MMIYCENNYIKITLGVEKNQYKNDLLWL